jgi:amidase
MSRSGAGSTKRFVSPEFIRSAFKLGLLLLAGWGWHSAVASAQFRVDETTIPQVESAFGDGTLTCRQLVEAYLDRIAARDQTGPTVDAFLELNPEALTIADQLDQDFRQHGPVGPLHCVPMVLKDNYGTADLNHTTAGSLTMLGFHAPSDSFQAAKLRAAGAVFLGKVNMDEWAIGTSGYSSRGGQTRNPYRNNRGPGGSSAGTGVAVSANFALAGVGTDTLGSIQLPAAFDGIVGVRPTSGLTGRTGIIPGALFSDASGPMTRTVTDAAILLGVMAGIDPDDPATEASAGKSFTDYTQFLDRDGLRNAHIGVVRSLFGKSLSGDNGEVDATFNHAVAEMRRRGALITDSVSIDGSETIVTTFSNLDGYWLKPGLDGYFAEFGANAPVHSLADIIAASEKPGIVDKIRPATLHALIDLQKLGGLTDPAYLSALATINSLRASLLQFMEQNGFDALVFPSTTCVAPPLPGVIDPDYQCGSVEQPLAPGEIPGVMPPVLSPIAGFPAIVVPAGFSSDGLPIEVSFFGGPFSEPTLIRLAFAFEQATRARRRPKFVEPTGAAAAPAPTASPTSALLSQP